MKLNASSGNFSEPICCASSIVIGMKIYLTGGKILNGDGELVKSDKVLRLQHGYHNWEHYRTMKVARAFHGSLMFQNLLKSKRKEVGEDSGENFSLKNLKILKFNPFLSSVFTR